MTHVAHGDLVRRICFEGLFLKCGPFLVVAQDYEYLMERAQGEDYIRRAFLVEGFKHTMSVTRDVTLKRHIINCAFYSLGASQPIIDHQFVFYMYDNRYFVRTCFPIS